jgi:hypothetical protein
VIEQLIHRVKIRQSELQMALASGVPPTWDSYNRLVGEYQGLQKALDLIDAMLEEEKNID